MVEGIQVFTFNVISIVGGKVALYIRMLRSLDTRAVRIERVCLSGAFTDIV